MNKENLILVGGGGHAKACIDVILSTNKYNIIGYLDLSESLSPKYNIPYLGTDNEMGKYISNSSFLITVGQINNPNVRIKLFEQLKKNNAKLPVIISSNAYVSPHASIAEGTIIMHGAVVQFNASIGMNCIINDKALVEHDATVGNHCHISTGAILNGDVSIANNVFIGSGAVLKNGIQIGANVVVGSGSNVIHTIDDNKTVAGNPAKFIK